MGRTPALELRFQKVRHDLGHAASGFMKGLARAILDPVEGADRMPLRRQGARQ
jgi:hypothetical protein